MVETQGTNAAELFAATRAEGRIMLAGTANLARSAEDFARDVEPLAEIGDQELGLLGRAAGDRLHGDAEAAAKVYAGVAEPLSADDVAACIAWTLELPAHVNIDSMVVRPRAQASNTLVAREQ